LHILHLVGASVFFCSTVLSCWARFGVRWPTCSWSLVEGSSFVGGWYTHGISRIHPSMGSNVFLGGYGDHQLSIHITSGGRKIGYLTVGGL